MKYPIYQPRMAGNEKKYVNDCLDSTWISSKGKYINLFEEAFADYIGTKHSTTVSNGTVALHLALLALDVKTGDEVILPSFTYVATANAVTFTGAKPVFADSLRDTWQISPEDIKKKITQKTRAIIIVHLYGHPCEMDEIVDICKENNLFLIEDCAEAIGSEYKKQKVGNFGDISTFSFYGNKTITTGEGGMVISDNKNLIDMAYHYKNQAVTKKQYWHDLVGYNYRMTNIQAAIGLAQLEQLEKNIIDKSKIASIYREAFENTEIEFHKASKNVFHSYWMCSILLKDENIRDRLVNYLSKEGIDTRPLFYPAHKMPAFADYNNIKLPVAEDLCYRGINLPSWPDLKEEDVNYIAKKIIYFIEK